MTLQSAADRRGLGRAIAAALAGGALAVGLMAGAGMPMAQADDNMNPQPPVLPVVPPAAIVPNGVTGEAAKAAQAAAANPVAAAPGAVPVDPATATAPDAAAAPMTPDQLIAEISKEYDTGRGGGQISNLVHSILQLRSQGFKPSKANTDALIDALDHRPNQGPLIAALKETLATQQKQKSQLDAVQGNGQSNPFMIGFMPGEPGGCGDFCFNPGG